MQPKPDVEKLTSQDEVVVAPIRKSDEPPLKKFKWINKQRVLIFASRGIIYRARHVMNNLRTLLPHSKPDTKMEKRDSMQVINEICEMKNCNKCIYFESKKKKDLFAWFSNVPNGPSAKFLVENVHTMEELKMTGNCLKGSRAILSFDTTFDEIPHYALLKEMFIQIFGTPYHHPKSQPFIDHVFTFTIVDKRIWFRNYQIVEEDGSLAEIGPRFVLNPICVFGGSFGGPKLWENPSYVSPNEHRRMVKLSASRNYVQRVEAKAERETRASEMTYDNMDPTDLVFETLPFDETEEKDMNAGSLKKTTESSFTAKKTSIKRKGLKSKRIKLKGTARKPKSLAGV